MEYKTKYVWNDNGLCDIRHLFKKRHCRICGRSSRFLINVGKKQYEHLMCGVQISKGD
jgi:hypothetical protein